MIRSRMDGDFSPLQSKEYEKLFESLPTLRKSYFNHPYFLFECLHAFSETEPCFLFSVYEDDRLIGFDAFRKAKINLRKINIPCLVPAGFRIAEYNQPAVDSKYYSEFFQQLSLATEKEALFYHNATGFFSEWFKKEVKDSFIYSISSNPILRNTDDGILQASLKKGIVRDYKSLQKKTKVEIHHLKDNISDRILNQFFDLHIRRWSSQGINSKFLQQGYRKIYYSLCNIKIPEYGQVVLSYIKSDEEFLAMHIGFIINNSFLYQIPAFDIKEKSKSPGTVLLKAILDFIVNEGLDVFDMGYGIEEYKFRYMNDVVNYFSVARFSNPVYQKLFKIKIR